MKKSLFVIGAIMFALLFAGCKGAEDTSSEGLKEALLELADDAGDKVIEDLFDNPKVVDFIKISLEDSDTLVIKDIYGGEEYSQVLSFTLTDDGVKATITIKHSNINDSFIIKKIEFEENDGRSAEISDYLLTFYNKDETKQVDVSFYNGVLSGFWTPYLY